MLRSGGRIAQLSIILCLFLTCAFTHSFSLLAGCRIGEASNPGPPPLHLSDDEGGGAYYDIDQGIDEQERLLGNHDSYDSDVHPLLDSSSDEDSDGIPPFAGDSDSGIGEARLSNTPTGPAHRNEAGRQAKPDHDEETQGGCIFTSWDWNLDQMQRKTWETAEAVGNCTFSKRRDPRHSRQRRANTRHPKKDQAPPSGDFTAASAFRGSFDGYVF